jgi:hypothetical protein
MLNAAESLLDLKNIQQFTSLTNFYSNIWNTLKSSKVCILKAKQTPELKHLVLGH